MRRAACAKRSTRSQGVDTRRPPRATSISRRRSPARPPSRLAMRSRSVRCARCTWPSPPRRSLRTTSTAARRSCISPGTRSSAALVDAELRIICGPTAAGKTTLAMALAERFGAHVVSADSRQIYRGFDIGTAKPTIAEQMRIPHHGVDVASPTERYSAAAWAEGAQRWLAECAAANAVPVVVGGTGFYIRALTAPLFAEPELDPARRRVLAHVLDALPTAELRRWCEQLDP